MTVFLDTNVVLDILDDTRPFAKEGLLIFQAAEERQFRIVLTSQSVVDSAYIMRGHPLEQFKKSLKKIVEVGVILPITDMEILRALKSDCPDFEDALQIACAESNTVNILVTNNKKDFERFTDLPVYTSKEFVMRITR
jgi:predicted nucleic acid-binding protein